MKINLASYKGIAIIYAIFVIGAIIYFVGLQHFGYGGLAFDMAGKDHVLTLHNIAIILAAVVSAVLLMLSLAAFGKKETVKMFIICMIFFFFLVKNMLVALDNFFPRENIYTGNAVAALELLTLLSFVLLIYNMYRARPAGSAHK